jgi:hypothetical protein
MVPVFLETLPKTNNLTIKFNSAVNHDLME